ncbi:MAG: DUF1629 domain-containing protein [Pseudomonadota bacterium]
MIRSGYSAFDVPGEHKTLMSPDMIAELPKTIWMDEVPKTGVRDFHPVDSGFIVSQRVRDKLEELEPGAHGFYPVTLRHDRKKTELGTWYWHHLHQRPDILDLENTLFKNWVIKDGRGRMEPYVGLDDNSFMKGEPRLWEINPTRKGSDRLINFKHPPDGHLWRGSVGTDMRWITTRTSGPEWGCRTTYTDRLANELFCSDLFAAWMESEGVTGLRPRKIIEKPARSYVETQWKG